MTVNKLRALQDAFATFKPGETPRPGQTIKVIQQLDPADRAGLLKGMFELQTEEELGRHGNPLRVADKYDADLYASRRCLDGLQIDAACLELSNRKSDADLPLPEPTRRDHIDAAFTAHTEL